MLGRNPGVTYFVVVRNIETYRIRIGGLFAHFRQCARHGGAVGATAQEGARFAAIHSLADALTQQRAEFLLQLPEIAGDVFLVAHFPIGARLDPVSPIAHIAARRHSVLISEDTGGTRHHMEIDVVKEALLIDRWSAGIAV